MKEWWKTNQGRLPRFWGLVRCVCGGDGGDLLSIGQQRSIGRLYQTQMNKRPRLCWMCFSKEQHVAVHKYEPPPSGCASWPDANTLWCCHLPFAHGQPGPSLHNSRGEKWFAIFVCVSLFLFHKTGTTNTAHTNFTSTGRTTSLKVHHLTCPGQVPALTSLGSDLKKATWTRLFFSPKMWRLVFVTRSSIFLPKLSQRDLAATGSALSDSTKPTKGPLPSPGMILSETVFPASLMRLTMSECDLLVMEQLLTASIRSPTFSFPQRSAGLPSMMRPILWGMATHAFPTFVSVHRLSFFKYEN